MGALDLAGTWCLQDVDGEFACDMPIPGDAISALIDAGHLPDPYSGRNEETCRWPAEREWIVTRDFICFDTNCDVVIDGLDTVAEVSINGQSVLAAQNAFRTYRADASHALRHGENQIAIMFRSNVREAERRQNEQPHRVPYSTANCPIPNGNMLRKVQCDFGWDWNIALAPFGLYGTVLLDPRNAPRLEKCVVSQTHEPGVAVVAVDISAKNAETARLALCGHIVELALNQGIGTAIFEIREPELWWPAGLGPQTLHELTVTIGTTVETRRIGLRDIELLNEPDSVGTGFRFRINGHDTFIRGANWVPADALFSRITPDGTRDLLQSALDANMNMLRVWGGGRYEADWFYQMCDEMGLLIWQDLMFACNLYPADTGFLDEVRQEVKDQVTRLNHHACIALWCGDNELVGALTWYPEARANRDRYLVAYDRLNRTTECALRDVAPQANWWPSSPAAGPMDFGDAWHDDSKGDMHFWSVWHEGRDFEHYRDVSPRFCSEFGFQSFPSMDVIERFASPEDQNIASPVMEAHQKNAGGNARIAETMFRYFRFPQQFDDFVYLSQVQQGLAIKTAVEFWRSLKPHCMGTLYWQLNDTWPVASWSSLNHGGSWKLLHYMARRFYAPQHVVAIPAGPNLQFVAMNDDIGAADAHVTAFALDLTGNLRQVGTAKKNVGHDRAETLLTCPFDDAQLIWFEWTLGTATGSDHIASVPYKHMALPDPAIRYDLVETKHGHTVTLHSKAPALFVSLEADQHGRFSDNAITLLPDRPAALHFIPKTKGKRPVFRIRDLYSATHRSATQTTLRQEAP